jgi:hypothetical protein
MNVDFTSDRICFKNDVRVNELDIEKNILSSIGLDLG